MMAGRPREPIDLIKAKGKKHLTQAEYEERKNSELQVPFTDVQPPDFLTAKQKREFMEIADQLLQLNIMTELDVNVLGQYIIAKTLYLEYSDQLKKVMSKRNAVHKWGVIEEIASNCEDEDAMRNLLEAILRRQRGDDATVLMNLQDKAFKQCLACAKELGLTITSRVKLVIPQPPDDDDDEL
ncbi:phage terminase small subunit P27 family [Listeria monocytogenes]|nr:phage terminase small subunit P27 family [Listeria monocytogenes]